MIFDKILGLNRNLFVILLFICLALLILCFFLYFALVFLDLDSIKIVENLKGKRRILNKRISFLVPLYEKVVCTYRKTTQLANDFLLINVKNNNYKIYYSFKYLIVDPLKHYSKINDFSVVFSEIKNRIVDDLMNQSNLNVKKIQIYLNRIDFSNCTAQYGVSISEFLIQSIEINK